MSSSSQIARKLGSRGLQNAGRVALAYIEAHPGCSILDVDRNVRTARGGHKWMYATVNRLISRGLVRTEKAQGRSGYALYATAS
jgi:hypothetical protein